MSKHLATVVLASVIASVPIADVPVAVQFDLAGQESQKVLITDLAAINYSAMFTVEDGDYAGQVQYLRADGSVIGEPIAYVVSAPVDMVLAPAGGAVSVTVVPAP